MTASIDAPVDTVEVTAPVRIADVGGWTDTWFAGSGAVCHIGVEPGVRVVARRFPRSVHAHPVRVCAPDLGEDYRFGPSHGGDWTTPTRSRQPLLEHAIASVLEARALTGDIEVSITSAVPVGASLGTSGSVLVATIAALEQLGGCADRRIRPISTVAFSPRFPWRTATDSRPRRDLSADRVVGSPTGHSVGLSDDDRQRLAEAAHRVETERVGRQAGVQDHWAAAFGGAQLLIVDDYPHVARSVVPLAKATAVAIDTQVVTVVFASHDSSAVHASVIGQLRKESCPDGRARRALGELAELARQAATELERSDLTGWASTLTRATDVQAELHPGLVGLSHRLAIGDAHGHGALGWKVNGAGGDGGSLSIVFASGSDARRFRRYLTDARPDWIVPELSVSPGLTIRPTSPDR